MIERIVLIKLNDDLANDAGRAEIAAETTRRLREVPGPIGVKVGVPADDPAKASWDLSILVRFESLDDIPAYIADATHRAYVDDYMDGKVACLKAWNFER